MTAKVAKRVTNKMLMDEINILREEVKEVPDVPEIVRNINEFENRIECKICEQYLSSKKLLKKHCSDIHSSKINCKKCEETFIKTSDLEVHLKTNHKQIEEHTCDHCGKTFALQWRLKKHKEGHEDILRKCIAISLIIKKHAPMRK